MLIVTVGFLVVAFARPGCFGTVSEPERHQVVIVGAGVSGIAAAATLLENNVNDIIILEASDRVGGRVHTLEYGGITVDNGAEFVQGEEGNPVYEMVKSQDLLVSYLDKYLQPEKYFFTNTVGDDFNSTYVRNLLFDAYNILEFKHPLPENVSVMDFFFSKFDELLKEKNIDAKLGEAILHLVLDMLTSEHATDDISVLGASTFKDYDNYPGDTSLRWKQPHGYRIVIDHLTKKYPNSNEELPVLSKIQFNKEVTQIKYGKGKEVEIKCADGSSYLADHVIVTVSLGVLKKHADTMFQPALPERKTAAIKELGMGCLGKIWILFPRRWWPQDINVLLPLFSNEELGKFKNDTVHGYWSADLNGFLPVVGSDRMLKAWYSGKPCRIMESLADDQAIDGVMELLNWTMGRKFKIPRPESILRSSWSKNPYTVGSYSYRSVSSDKHHLTNSDLAEPVITEDDKPALLFAGEATSFMHYATVPGALEAGRREAHYLINYLKNNVHS